MVISAANCIENEKEEINGLNIFPVPDGDTGTNMSLTMQAGKKEMMTFNGTLGECSAKVASALLRGGRGNSGVILSLFFRGFSKELAGKTEADICDLCRRRRRRLQSGKKPDRRNDSDRYADDVRKSGRTGGRRNHGNR